MINEEKLTDSKSVRVTRKPTKAVSQSLNPLAKPIALLPGIGEKTVLALTKNQIFNLFDLLLHVPKAIVEQEDCPGIRYLESGRRYVVTGKVFQTKLSGHFSKRRFEAVIQDETGRMLVVFFGPATTYAQQILKNDATVTVAGEAKNFLGRIQMVHPTFATGAAEKKNTNFSSYSQLGGLPSANFKRIVTKALGTIAPDHLIEHAPAPLIAKNNMTDLKNALVAVHNPEDGVASWDDKKSDRAFRRLAFEELVSFYLRLNLERNLEKRKSATAIATCALEPLIENFLPFSLTQAQIRVINEIIADLSSQNAMTRLLQGDVGSGKTAVSAVVALHVANAGLQIAVMAPTEILAEQLFLVYQRFFANKPHKIALLTASVKTKERRAIAEQIKTGELTIVVGTHALLSDDIQFNKLGLVVIDEQHRFGVKQRAELFEKCGLAQGFSPHLLVMSATPIPRSLALTLYGDLDLSVIDERPPGRVPIHTQILAGPVLSVVEKLCERILATNQKAFIVFPLVEESENLDLENATRAVQKLKGKFGNASAALLHGKMKPEEKAAAMNEFRDNKISFLVATTVVEVGVDVPDATCMIIVHAERFGLAQLHQLRGRVGRKDLKSFCFLVTDITNKFGGAFKRLDAMCRTDNGFKLAEVDLEIRGPGELLGTKQSGLPNFLIFNHTDFPDLVSPAKMYAKTIADDGLSSVHLHLYHNKEAHFS